MLEIEKPLKPVLLVILDGWGIAPPGPGNAIELAKKPYFNSLLANYPHTQLTASEESVGLPKGESGNSEVGHLNIGAGRIVQQDLPRINSAIADGSFSRNESLIKAYENTLANNSNLHLLGLVGTAGGHSSVKHLYALLLEAKEHKVKNVYLHLFTDGRDSSTTAGVQVLNEIQKKIDTIGIGKIASITGRYWAMDRDNRWERTEKAYRTIVLGQGIRSNNVSHTIESSYQKNITDEFIEPTLITSEDNSVFTVKDNDSVIFFNFRPDRARQLTESFVLPEFLNFDRETGLKNIVFVTMTEYEKNLPVLVAFPLQVVEDSLAKIISDNGLKQLHIGETEKYAHVTYFFNGGREESYSLEHRVHIPSPKVITYDLKPEMSATELTDYVVAKLKEDLYEFYIVNFANADMVGHTGSISATEKAIEILDSCLEKIGNEVLGKNGVMIVTADHGNAETMLNPTTGEVDTAHSRNQVPFVVVAKVLQKKPTVQLPPGILADVAPSVLSLFGIEKPDSMSGRNLLGIRVKEIISTPQ